MTSLITAIVYSMLYPTALSKYLYITMCERNTAQLELDEALVASYVHYGKWIVFLVLALGGGTHKEVYKLYNYDFDYLKHDNMGTYQSCINFFS